METEDLRTLKILEKLDNDEAPSQRDLAQHLNISLGLVNSFIKRLVKKGYFKIGHLPKNRISYILTPRGVAEKSRLTYEYIQYSYHFYKRARQKICRLYSDLEKQGVRHIIFYGAGDLAEIAYVSLQHSSIELVTVVDDWKAGQRFMQMTIAHPDQIESHQFDRILVAAIKATDAIQKKLAEMGISPEIVVEIG
jgi:DNA-binding MarR family transcriptional regulator